MTLPELPSPCPSVVAAEADQTGLDSRSELTARRRRLRAIVDRQYDFVWRAVRYLGVSDASAEDAAQEVLCVLARRLDEIEPNKETAFLFSTAMRVASHARRSERRRPQMADEEVDALVAPWPSPDELVDARRAQGVLQEVLEAMPVDLRIVFVLFELEELTLAQIADCLAIPHGTAASRLRRARDSFQSIVERRQARHHRSASGEGP